jgi:hypothetical protein
MPIHAQFGVPCAWLIDAVVHVLEVYALENGNWRKLGRFAGSTPVSVPPFDAVPIDLSDLWAPT